MVLCKSCHSDRIVKNETVRGKKRYKCKVCALNFVESDFRVKACVEIKKALAGVLYSLGKASFGMLGKIFGHSRSLIYRWIVKKAEKIPEPAVSNNIQEIEFDEMWHFVKKKLKNSGLSKHWIVAQGELLPGLQVVVMLQPSNDSTTK